MFNNPLTNFYHVGTELKWLAFRGAPRALGMLLGLERFRVDPRILREGHARHYTGANRVTNFGRMSRKRKSYYGRA